VISSDLVEERDITLREGGGLSEVFHCL
jgi:hypothetical protein